MRTRWLVAGSLVATALLGLVLSVGVGLLDWIRSATSSSSGCPPIADPPYSWAPAWSPDGHKIAFLRGDRDWDVYVVKADGSNERRLTHKGIVKEFVL